MQNVTKLYMSAISDYNQYRMIKEMIQYELEIQYRVTDAECHEAVHVSDLRLQPIQND